MHLELPFSSASSRERANRKLVRAAKAFYQRARYATQPEAAKRVVFLAGVPRSGTNLLMSVLDRNFHTAVFREGDPRAFEDFELRPPEVIRRLYHSAHAPLVVFKALLDAHDLRALGAVYTGPRFIWVFRHYDDVVNSNMRRWSHGNYLDRLVADPAAAGWRGAGMTAQTLDTVRRHYHGGINQATAQALFWYYRSQLLFDQSLDRDPACHLIHYEAYVRAPEASTERLCRFLDVPYAPFMIRPVRTSSIGKDATPDIEPEVRRLCDGMYARLLDLVAEPAAA